VTPLLRTARHAALTRWPWVVPVGVLAFIYRTHGRFLERAIAASLALLVIILAARRPDRSLLILIVVLPFQGLLLAQLYSWGVPAALVRPLSSWKEALALGVVIAGIRGYRAGPRHPDALDRLGLAYVAIVAAYAAAPGLFAPRAPADANTRSLAFRSIAGFVILLIAARHARLPEQFASRAARVVMIVGAVVAGIAVYEYFFSNSWNSFIVDGIQYIRYQVNILHTTPFSATDIRRYGDIGGQHVVRVGSVFLDPTPCGFFLVLPFAVAVEHRLRSGLRGRASLLLLLLIGTALILTQTRAALISSLVVVFLAVRHIEGRNSSRRIQFALIFAAAIVLALPAITATGLNERVTTTTSGQNQSSMDHLEAFWNGVHAIETEPLGHGVGTSAGIGQRFSSAKSTVTENNYLQVGIETGVIAMVLFGALTVAMLRRLRRAAASGDLGTSTVWSAGLGLAIGAFLLHAWNEFSVAWVFWGLAGAAIGISDRAAKGEAPAAPAQPAVPVASAAP
jgi:O-antigen ligase